MDLLNATGMVAGYTLGMEPSGREHLVVAVKGTFQIPMAGREPEFAEAQLPLIEADTYTGESGVSAPVYEVDYAFRKPRCDVLLNGSAYAPKGKPTTKVQVGLKLGSVAKTFRVVGDRSWEAKSVALGPSYPATFTVMPISYDCAFGGLDNFHAEAEKHTAYMANPVGRGFHRVLSASLVDGTPLPNSEEDHRPIRMPNADYRPMAFGPLGRGWDPRRLLAGTYDDHWLDNVFPFLPSDFDEAYYQAAPTDQQMPYPRGGEIVSLLNLTPEGQENFRLPAVEVPVVFFRKRGQRHETQGVIDTIVLEPDKGTFSLTWRASIALKKNIFEVVQVLVGKKPRAWWRARALGKDYYPSVAAMVQARQPEPEEETE